MFMMPADTHPQRHTHTDTQTHTDTHTQRDTHTKRERDTLAKYNSKSEEQREAYTKPHAMTVN